MSVQTRYHCEEEEEEEEQTDHCGLFSARHQLMSPPVPSSPVSSAPALAPGFGSGWWSLAGTSAKLPVQNRDDNILKSAQNSFLFLIYGK